MNHSVSITLLAILALIPQDKSVQFEGFGRVEEKGFLADGGSAHWRLQTSEKFEPGTRLWIRGSLLEGVLDIADFERVEKAGAKEIPPGRKGETLEVEFTKVNPWCDHMPTINGKERRQYLVVTVKLQNRTDADFEVRMARTFLSFDADKEGRAVSGLTVRGEDGRGSGETVLRLRGGEARQVEWRGDNLYEEGHHDQDLHVALVFAAGKDRLLVRHAGAVMRTD